MNGFNGTGIWNTYLDIPNTDLIFSAAYIAGSISIERVRTKQLEGLRPCTAEAVPTGFASGLN